MAYALGFPKDVTGLLYSMRDKNNWNRDKYQSTPLGKLLTWPGLPHGVVDPGSFPRCGLEIDPEPPTFVGRGQVEGVEAEVYTMSWVSHYPNVCVRQQDPDYPWCYDEVVVLRLSACWDDFAKPPDFFTCEPCLPNNQVQ